MNWTINYSEKAFNDLKAIYEYIAFDLYVPNTASEQVNRIMDSVKTLNSMPMMHPVYPEEPWKSKGIRFFQIDNYLVWYLPQEKQKAVNIVRIMYGGRDFSKMSADQLQNPFGNHTPSSLRATPSSLEGEKRDTRPRQENLIDR